MRDQSINQRPAFGQESDISAKRIFGNHTLCAQFLRDYSGLPVLADVQPEDIEDVTERYHLFREVELQADTVKKVHILKRGEGQLQESDIYIISLIEHKSSVDYDISMQILKYMVCIWENEAAETEKHEGGESENVGNAPFRGRANKKKEFRYPPIYPIVYYEGSGEWTAAKNLKDRILLGEVFESYIPNFTYKLVRTQEYSKEELLSKEDVVSLLMLLNKIQQARDFEELSGLPSEKLNGIMQRAPVDVAEIVVSAVRSLCGRLNLPEKETAALMKKVEDGDMGYLWENMEKMDIQMERRNAAEARQALEETKQKAEQEKMELYRLLIASLRQQGMDREAILDFLETKAGLDGNAACRLLESSEK